MTLNSLSTLSPQPAPPTGGLVRTANDSAADKSLFHILWRRRRIVAAITAVALLIGLLYALIARPTYTTVSRLFIEAAGGKKAGQDTADRAAFLYTQREVITSTPVIATALGEPGILDFQFFAKDRDAITALRNRLSVEVGKKDDLVSVSLDSPYPNEATQIVAAVVDAYAKFQLTQRTALTSDTLSTLAAEKARIDKEVADRSSALQSFALEHNIVGPEIDASSDNESLKSIAASLTQAHLDTLAVNARLSTVAAPADTATAPADPQQGSFSVEDEASVRQQLLAAETTLEAMTAKYPASYPMLKAAKTRVDQLKRQRYAILQSVKQAAVRHEADLKAYYNAEQRRHIEQRAFAADYAKMNGERQRLQERADAIDTRLRDLKVNDEGKMADVSVLEPAHTDKLPTGPNKPRVLAIALAAGLMLGLMAALAWDQFDSRFESIAEIDRWLGLATLGVLPALPGSPRPIGRALYIYSEPESPFAHACHDVWTAVNAVTRGAPVHTLAITSPSKEDGRTTAACGLAISMAQQGRRTLLIDADVHAPKLATVLGVDIETGLADLFDAPSVDAAQVRRATRETLVPNLYLLAGGRIDSIDRPNLPTVLEAAAREFDVVIVDTPAAHKDSVARVVAANCQATLLVVRQGRTDCFAAGRVRNDLYNVGANVLGVVLNQAYANVRAGGVTVTSAAGSMPMLGSRGALGLPANRAGGASEGRPAGGLSVAS